MPQLDLAFDDNLGYPEGLPEQIEQHVSDALGAPWRCVTTSFHELDQMIDAFVDGRAQLMFLPCGCFPYVSSPLAVMGQATTGDDRRRTLTSVLVVRSDTDAQDLASAAGLRFGCINRFCTTSFWAPSFVDQLHPPGGDGPALEWVGGFDDLVASVCDGRAEAAMVWEPYLRKHADEADRWRELDRQTDLPAPVLVADPSLDPGLLDALRAVVPLHNSSHELFNGLAEPDRRHIEAFCDHLRRADPAAKLAPLVW